jgi:hypothetical protein
MPISAEKLAELRKRPSPHRKDKIEVKVEDPSRSNAMTPTSQMGVEGLLALNQSSLREMVQSVHSPGGSWHTLPGLISRYDPKPTEVPIVASNVESIVESNVASNVASNLESNVESNVGDISNLGEATMDHLELPEGDVAGIRDFRSVFDGGVSDSESDFALEDESGEEETMGEGGAEGDEREGRSNEEGGAEGDEVGFVVAKERMLEIFGWAEEEKGRLHESYTRHPRTTGIGNEKRAKMMGEGIGVDNGFATRKKKKSLFEDGIKRLGGMYPCFSVVVTGAPSGSKFVEQYDDEDNNFELYELENAQSVGQYDPTRLELVLWSGDNVKMVCIVHGVQVPLVPIYRNGIAHDDPRIFVRVKIKDESSELYCEVQFKGYPTELEVRESIRTRMTMFKGVWVKLKDEGCELDGCSNRYKCRLVEAQADGGAGKLFLCNECVNIPHRKRRRVAEKTPRFINQKYAEKCRHERTQESAAEGSDESAAESADEGSSEGEAEGLAESAAEGEAECSAEGEAECADEGEAEGADEVSAEELVSLPLHELSHEFCISNQELLKGYFINYHKDIIKIIRGTKCSEAVKKKTIKKVMKSYHTHSASVRMQPLRHNKRMSREESIREEYLHKKRKVSS